MTLHLLLFFCTHYNTGARFCLIVLALATTLIHLYTGSFTWVDSMYAG
jgi:hypothetical protein